MCSLHEHYLGMSSTRAAGAGGWGTFAQAGPTGLPSATVSLHTLHGTATISTLTVVSSATIVHATVDGKTVGATISQGVPPLLSYVI